MIQMILKGFAVVNTFNGKNPGVSYAEFTNGEGQQIQFRSEKVDLTKLPKLEKQDFNLSVKSRMFGRNVALEIVAIGGKTS